MCVLDLCQKPPNETSRFKKTVFKKPIVEKELCILLPIKQVL